MKDVCRVAARRICDVDDGNLYVGPETNLLDKRLQVSDADAKLAVAAGLIERVANESPAYYRLTRAGLDLVGLRPTLDVQRVIEHVLTNQVFLPSDILDGRTAIPAVYVPSQIESRLTLVLGDNASGKSLFRRMLYATTHRGLTSSGFGDPSIPRGPFPVGEMLHLSMEGRKSTNIGSYMVYGEESLHSTGANSARTIQGALLTSARRNHTNIIYWDEPDIGMSAAVAAGAGIEIRQAIESEASPLTLAYFITSHSPHIVKQLVGLDPHCVFLGGGSASTLDTWLEMQENPVPIYLSTVNAIAHQRLKDIQAVLKHRS